MTPKSDSTPPPTGPCRRELRLSTRTLPVMLGTRSALDLAAGLTMGASTAILFVTVLSRLPLWSLVGMATLPLALGAYADLHRDEIKPEEGYRLRDTVAKATIWTGILLCLALWISRSG